MDDPPDGFEERRLDDGCERAAGPDPHVGRVRDALLLQLEGDPVVDVVADVFLVGQNLVDGAARPGPPEIGQRCLVRSATAAISRSDRPSSTNSRYIRRTVSISSGGPGHQDDPVGLQALLLAARELALRLPLLVDQLPPQAEAGRAALPEAELDQPALPCEDLGRQLAAVLAGHRPLDALDDRGAQAAVVLELLGAVVDRDAGSLADVLVVGALVGVLEAAPAADVVDEDRAEIGAAGSGRRRSAASARRGRRAAGRSSRVGVGPHDLEAALRGVSAG